MANLRLRAIKRLRMADARCRRFILREISRLSESWLVCRARSAHRLLVFDNAILRAAVHSSRVLVELVNV